MKHCNKTIGLQDLVQGFLFSLQAEGCALLTHEYYDKLLTYFLRYAKEQGWPDRVDLLGAKNIRQFLSWVGSRVFNYTAGNGSCRCVKAKPSTAWRYYKALRRLFNWSVEESLLEESPIKGIHFNPGSFDFVEHGTCPRITKAMERLSDRYLKKEGFAAHQYR